MEDLNKKASSRRDFLKKSLKAVGYSVPAMMAFSTVSLDAFAHKYPGNHNVTFSNNYNLDRIRRYLQTNPRMLEYLKQNFPRIYQLLYK